MDYVGKFQGTLCHVAATPLLSYTSTLKNIVSFMKDECSLLSAL